MSGHVPREDSFGGAFLGDHGREIDCLSGLVEMAGEVAGDTEAEPVVHLFEIELNHGRSTSVPTKGTRAAGTRTLPSGC